MSSYSFGVRAAVLLMTLVPVACIQHPGLPATTDAAFHAKGAATAEAAASTTATVSLVLGAEASGRTTARYRDAVVSGQEDMLAGVQGGYAALTPPSTSAAREQRQVLELLGDASDHLREVRERLALGDRSGALGLRRELARDTERLQERAR